MSRNWMVVSVLTIGLVASAARSAVADDPIPAAGYETGTRMVKILALPHAPVVVDYAYVTLHDGADGKHDSLNASCVRYRNVSDGALLSVEFQLTYYDGAGHRLGSDVVRDATKRVPNPNARPGKVLVPDSYWSCAQRANPYGATIDSAIIVPTRVTFASGKSWHT